MTYTILVPFIDLAFEEPRVEVTVVNAASDEDADVLANSLAHDARRLMDVVVPDWRQEHQLARLGGGELLEEYGLSIGRLQVWCGERFVSCVESPFTPMLEPAGPDSLFFSAVR